MRIDNKQLYKADFKYYFFLFIIYSLSHVWIFFISDAFFWDDWILDNSKDTEIIKYFTLAGHPWLGYLHIILENLGPSFYRFLTFFLMLITGFLFDLILLRTSKFNLDERFLLVAFFLVVPVNISRVLMITIPYTICYFLFFFAWYLKPINKLLSYFLFFISFATNSLLVFHLLPISYYYFIENKEKISFKCILKYLKNNLIFISLPIFYYLLKIFYFKPF